MKASIWKISRLKALLPETAIGAAVLSAAHAGDAQNLSCVLLQPGASSTVHAGRFTRIHWSLYSHWVSVPPAHSLPYRHIHSWKCTPKQAEMVKANTCVSK